VKNTVREHREKLGLTQEQLGQRLRVSRQTVISIETGRYNPSVVLAWRLLDLFHCRIEDLFELEEAERL
jgi:putative transcriptional regulator